MSESNGKRIAKNTTFLYLRMLVVMLINIFSVRYILKGLGVVDYGVFNVVAGLVTMFSSLSNVISSATLRFHSYAIGEGKQEKISDVFSASFNIYATLAIVLVIIGEAVGVWFINTQADIPIDRMVAANWVFQFSIISFAIGLMTAPFSSLIFAYERMQVFSIISVSECLLKFLLALSLLIITYDHLIFYGAGLLTLKVLHFFTYFVLSKKGGGKYHYKKHVERILYKQMLSFSGWTLFSSSAGIGISQLVTMITNVFFGPVVNAARAISFQVNSAFSSFSSNIIMAIKPPMIKAYAEGNHLMVNAIFKLSNKAVYFSMLLIALPLFFEMKTVLSLWLDLSDAQTLLFCQLILVYVLLLALNNPISIIVQATGNIKAYSTYVEIPTLLVFPVTWLLFAIGMPAHTAYYVMIVAVILSHIIRLVCLKKLFPVFSYKDYIYGFVLPASLITIITIVPLYFIHISISHEFVRLIVSLVSSCILVSFLCIILGFTIQERKMITTTIIPLKYQNITRKIFRC